MNKLTQAAEQLLAWYGRNGRALPWRSDVSPYHVWLSEIMLQQTRVETVTDYYRRFLKALPDIESLADAPEDLCLKLWEGLGYYSRIRNMQRAARIVMESHDGCLPDTREELEKLPGIGEYTAAAIASIAFGRPEPAIDGNLMRVYARVQAYGEDVKSEAAKREAARFFLPMMTQAIPSALLREALQGQVSDAKQAENLPGAINQALMDLGATVCLPNSAPRCAGCPWETLCEAHRQGKETDYPVRTARKARVIEERTVLVILYEGRIAIRKRPRKGLLAGLYELPGRTGQLDETGAVRFAKELGFAPLRVKRLPPAKHIFTHREWHMIGYEVLADELAPYASPQRPDEPVLLAGKDELSSVYSIPSAFSAYLSLYI